MLTWGSVIVQVLRLISSLVTWAQKRQLIAQGYDEAIAEASREIFRKTEHAKRVAEKIDAMSDDEVDAALVALEPAGDGPVDVQPRGTTTGSG